MKKIKIALIFGSLFFAFPDAHSQENLNSDQVEEEVVQKTLKNQFQEIKDKSNSYQEYKVIKITNLNSLWNSINDTLELQRIEYASAQKEIENQKLVIQKLKSDYESKNNELQKGEYEKSHINVIGIDFLKETYIYMNTIVIFSLLIFLAVVVYKYRESERIALIKKKDHDTIDKALTDFKAKSRERELKIKRELQTEMNRVQELSQELVLLRSRSTSTS